MKRCTYCGVENPDEAAECGACHRHLAAPYEPARQPGISAAEQRLWQRMTFREFFILMLRLQALLLLFRAVIELTYLLPMLTRILGAPSLAVGLRDMAPGLGWYVLRLLLQLAAAVALIQQAERVASWFVRDWIPRSPPKARIS